MFEAPLLKEHTTLCVTLKKPRVPVRSTVAGSFAPIYGPRSCTVRNWLHKEKNHVSAALPSSSRVEGLPCLHRRTFENLKQRKPASAKSQVPFSHARSMGTDRLWAGKIAER